MGCWFLILRGSIPFDWLRKSANAAAVLNHTELFPTQRLSSLDRIRLKRNARRCSGAYLEVSHYYTKMQAAYRLDTRTVKETHPQKTANAVFILICVYYTSTAPYCKLKILNKFTIFPIICAHRDAVPYFAKAVQPVILLISPVRQAYVFSVRFYGNPEPESFPFLSTIWLRETAAHPGIQPPGISSPTQYRRKPRIHISQTFNPGSAEFIP